LVNTRTLHLATIHALEHLNSKAYRAAVTGMDRKLGVLMDALNELGLTQNTVGNQTKKSKHTHTRLCICGMYVGLAIHERFGVCLPACLRRRFGATVVLDLLVS
jgi:hypothetical protein